MAKANKEVLWAYLNEKGKADELEILTALDWSHGTFWKMRKELENMKMLESVKSGGKLVYIAVNPPERATEKIAPNAAKAQESKAESPLVQSKSAPPKAMIDPCFGEYISFDDYFDTLQTQNKQDVTVTDEGGGRYSLFFPEDMEIFSVHGRTDDETGNFVVSARA